MSTGNWWQPQQRYNPYTHTPGSYWTWPQKVSELVDCAACKGTGKAWPNDDRRKEVCVGCNGAGKQRV
jgi:DnaJ-class molecular chaperone